MPNHQQCKGTANQRGGADARLTLSVLDVGNDLRWALRYARRHPAFTAAVTATLSVSIAAATTAFGLATAVLWRPLPFHDAAKLVFVWEENDRDGQRDRTRVTGARYAAWRDAANGLQAIALFGAASFTVDSADGAMSIQGVRVSANYFETLGIAPLLGRAFATGDETPGADHVVILSHALWRERFGGRRDAVGATLRLSGQPYTIVGVMPRAVFPAWPVNPATVTLDPGAPQLWVPFARTPALEASARAHVFGVLARLAPGVSERDVIERLNRTSDAAAPDPHRARLEPLREQFVAGARAPLIALAAAALAVLLIACTNLASLYVSAYESRRVELAVRAAIGAGAGRLVRQLALEAGLFAAAGAAGGIAIARVAIAGIPRWLPPAIPLLTPPAIDVPIAEFAIVLAVVASAMLTAWPIRRLLAAAPSPRGTTAPPRATIYRLLVISQVAITVALVAAAGLLGQSLQTVRHRDAGFTVDDVLVAGVGLPVAPTPNPAAIALAERTLVDAVAARPRVRAVATAYDHPLAANWSESLTIVGDSAAPDQRRQVELRIVSPGYVEALDVPLLDGRSFTDGDTLEAPGVALVNEAFARSVSGRVLGRRLLSAPPRFTYGAAAAAEFEIVGVVGNERFRGLEQPSLPAYYLSTRQFPQTAFSLLVRTDGSPLDAIAEVRAAVRSASAAATFTHATSLERILGDQLAERRVTTGVISGFAIAALVLAALGMYGLLAVLVGGRTREIGVRLAIGAPPAAVARQVVRESLGNAVAGIAIGSVLALAAGSLLQGLLVGVSSRDPATLGTVAALLVAVAAAAAFLPARRAARVDPVIALRAE